MADPATHFYSVFGLTLECNLPIHGLNRIQPDETIVDVRIRLGISPYAEAEISQPSEDLHYVSFYAVSSATPGLQIWRCADGNLRLQYFDGVQFWVDRRGTALWAEWPTTSSLEDVLSYLLGPVLGILLRIRGTICLHASAVVIKDRVIAFAGSEGAGKSTIAAALAGRGFRVVSDDVVALAEDRGTFRVLLGYQHLCLWPDSVQTLYGSADALPQLAAHWEKRRLANGSHGTRFEERILPLGVIYVFGLRHVDLPSRIDQLTGRKSLLSLAANMFASRILDENERAEEFIALGRLVSEVPVRRMQLGRNRAQLSELCDLICDDIKTITDSRAQEAASL